MNETKETEIREIGRIVLEDERELVFYNDGKAAIFDHMRTGLSVSIHLSASELTMIKDWFLENRE
jgi:hypothetical protein